MKFLHEMARAFLFLLAIAPGAVNAEDGTYRTSRGVVFARGSLGGVEAWRTPDGKTWSANIGQFSNRGRVSGEGLVTDSPATQACARLDGRLPTLAEVRFLAGYLREPGALPSAPLAQEDMTDYRTLFPSFSLSNGFSMRFWTADAAGPGSARMSLGLVDPYGDTVRMDSRLSVFCVAP
jgi:hypothetical protein